MRAKLTDCKHDVNVLSLFVDQDLSRALYNHLLGLADQIDELAAKVLRRQSSDI